MRKLWFTPLLALLFSASTLAVTNTKNLAASPGETLTFDLQLGGDIDVIGWDGEGAEITAEITGRDASQVHLSVERTASGIRVTTPRVAHDKYLSYSDGEEIKDHRPGRHTRVSVVIKAKVPHRYSVKIKTMGGDVRLRELEGEFTGETMGGDITLGSLTGQARVTTMGGDITVRDSTLDGKVRTMGGDVKLDNLDGNLDASTMGGDVIQNDVRRTTGRGAEKVTVSSHGGDVVVDTAPAGADVKTMGGDIRVRSVDEFLKAVTMGGDITIQQATGETEITTMGGDIEVESFDGQIQATTMGGDVEVNVVSDTAPGGHDIELNSMGGDIRLALPAGFSGRFEIELVKLRKKEDGSRIESDIALDVNEPSEWTPGNVRNGDQKYSSAYKIITATGSVGGGDNLVKLKTVNGVIRIKN